jgi:hypothetical protein
VANETVTTTEPVVEKTTHTVVDNTNLDAMLAEARGEKYEAAKPADAAKPTEAVKPPETEEEDEHGLTAEQRETFTENMKKTIGKKHRLQKEAEELAEEQYNTRILAEKRAATLEREVQRLKEQQAPAKTEEAKEPNRADFKDDKSYADAMIDWRVDQKLKSKEAEGHKQAQEDRKREIEAACTDRITKAREANPEFAAALETLEGDGPLVPVDVAGYMQESELVAELTFHFIKNPQELDKIIKLTPARQLVAIGKIESTLKPFSKEKAESSTGAKPETKDGKSETTPSTNAKASKARPEPIKPIDAGSSSQVEKPIEEMDFKEYKTHWQKTRKVNLGLRKRH